MMICVLSFPDNAERKRGREGERGRVSESQRERERETLVVRRAGSGGRPRMET